MRDVFGSIYTKPLKRNKTQKHEPAVWQFFVELEHYRFKFIRHPRENGNQGYRC